MDCEPIRGGVYVNLSEDTQLRFRVDPDGDGVEIVALGPIELSVGMTSELLRRCQELFAEAQVAIAEARNSLRSDARAALAGRPWSLGRAAEPGS